MPYARMLAHDNEQARRRTDAQNQAIATLIADAPPVEGDGIWGYTDIPPEGGTVELTRIATHQHWTVEIDGTVTETTPTRKDA